MPTTFDVSPHGSHVTSARTAAGELLFMSSLAVDEPGGSIRGGVPIIAPWFNDLTGQEPAHGWARREEWEVVEVPGGYDSRILVDDWDLRLAIQSTAKGFAMQLRARNAASKRRSVQLAFHPYFKVADILRTTVSDITFDGSEFDERLPRTDALLIDDGHRRLRVTGHEHDHTVVWNPGEEGGAALKDLGEGEWRHFVCVEPALLGPDEKGVSLAPWEWTSLGMTVAVED